MDSLLFRSNHKISAENELECHKVSSNHKNPKLDLISVTKEISNCEKLMPTVKPFNNVTSLSKSSVEENSKVAIQMGSINSKQVECPNLRPPMQETQATSKTPHPPTSQLQPMPNECPEVRNVIASTNLGCKLDLRYIAMHAKNVEYNPKLCDVLLMRTRRPFAVAFIYSNGKLICTGTKSCQVARFAARKFARVIQKLGIPVRFIRSRVDNIIASCKLNCKIRLEALELFRHKQCVYEPELFPSLVYRLPRLGSQVFVFSSGTIVLCNIRKMSRIQETFQEFYSIVQPFKKIKSISF